MRHRRFRLSHLLLYALLTTGSLVMVTPFLDMISTAFKSQTYVLEVPPTLIPREPTLQNFVDAWQSNHFALFFRNSLVVAVSTTVLSLLVSAMLAYGLARFEFPGKNLVFYAILLTMMIPSLMLIIPQFMLAKTLGLRNSLTGLVLVYTAMNIPLNTFLLRGFFEELPRELEEAVLIDGGGHFTIFTRMALPLSTPALATVAIFTFLAAWDEFTWALTAIDDATKRTLPVAIATFQGEHLTQWGLVFAASLVAILPVIIVFVTLQRYFVKGLTSGAVRG
ncbi:MAG: carbohydrate ABC transporter permease [Chloroflexi bacterium]|nr:carbohydrate ABC transporter permease [Chloroflexota bacterium]MBI5828964.1 carbohydrate ABC transporter permease [Chloroflexota bacterium]